MANKLAITPLALATIDASGEGASVDIGEYRTAAKLQLVVAALVGTSVEVAVQTSPDETSWRTVGSFTTATAAGTEELALVGLDRYVRVAYTLVGTSATLLVTGAAQQLFANAEDLEALSLGDALDGADAQKLNRALIAASGTAAGYLGNQYTLPLVSWGEDVTRHTASIAAYLFMVSTGYAPEGKDELIRLNYEDAIRWFEKVSTGKVKPDDIVDSTPTVEEGGACVVTRPLRGW